MRVFSGIKWCELLTPFEVCELFKCFLDEVRRDNPVYVRFNSVLDKVEFIEYFFGVPGLGRAKLFICKGDIENTSCFHEVDRRCFRRYCHFCGKKLFEEDRDWDNCDLPSYSSVAPELDRLAQVCALRM